MTENLYVFMFKEYIPLTIPHLNYIFKYGFLYNLISFTPNQIAST